MIKKKGKKKVSINGYGLFLWDGRKMKYDLFLRDGGVYEILS